MGNWKIAKCGFGDCISEEEITAHLLLQNQQSAKFLSLW